MSASHAALLDTWSRIQDRDCPLVLDERDQPLSDVTIAALLAQAPFTKRAEGPLASLATQMEGLPADLIDDALALADRFAGLMTVDAVRVRVERVDSNACWKVHADHTDVRLITTYAGPGTDFAPHGEDECCLERVSIGWIGLFKGRTYADGHAPCFHRSPPIAETGEKRLLLVIDTPARGSAVAV